MKETTEHTSFKSLVTQVAQSMETLNQENVLEKVNVDDLYSGVSYMRDKIDDLVALFKEAKVLAKKNVDDYGFFQNATSVLMWHSALKSVIQEHCGSSLTVPYISEGISGFSVLLGDNNLLTIYEMSDNQGEAEHKSVNYIQIGVSYDILNYQVHLSITEVSGGVGRVSEHVLKTPTNFGGSCSEYTKAFRNSGIAKVCKALSLLDYGYTDDKNTPILVYSNLIYSTADAHINTDDEDYKVEVESGIEVFKGKLKLVPKLSQSGNKALESLVKAVNELK